MATIQQLEQALIAADKAGNTEDATALAREIVRMRGSVPKQAVATTSQRLADIESDPYTLNVAGFDTGVEIPKWLGRGLAGAGKAAVDLGRGAGQILGLADAQDEAAAREIDAPLMSSTAGKVGQFAGSVAATAPAMLVPGVNTYIGATALGGGLGALQPVAGDDSRLLNTAVGGIGGAGGRYVGDKVGKYLAKTAMPAINKVKQATTEAARKAGYVMPPSQTEAGILPRIAEGLSGKYKTNQLAGIKNQKVTDALAKASIGIPGDEAITPEAIQAVKTAAYNNGYVPVSSSGIVKVDKQFTQALDDVVSNFQGASRSFPGAVPDDVPKMVDGLRVSQFDAGDGVKMAQELRNMAGEAYAAGKKGVGKAAKKAAGAIEDQIERHLAAQGGASKDMLRSFREARTTIAKAHTVEKALVEGTGSINAKVFAAELKKGKPLSGGQETIARFAQAFPDVAGIPKSGNANPFTVIDFGVGGLGVGSLNPYLAAMPVARAASRYSLLSSPVQNALAKEPKEKISRKAISDLLSSEVGQWAFPQATATGLLGVTK